MFIRTERLFLRPGWPEDLDDLLEALSDDTIRRMTVFALPRTREEIEAYLRRPRDPHLPHFFMYRRGEQGAKLVGGIELNPYRGEVEVGYWIAPRHRGQGYALEALRAVIDWARTLGHHRLLAEHFVDNHAAIRVLEAAGFHDAGSERRRYSAGREGEAPARLYVVDLERRAQPQAEIEDDALSA